MQKALLAFWENGVFRPIDTDTENNALIEGQHVILHVVEGGKVNGEQVRLTPKEVLALTYATYDGLSEEEIDEIEAITLDRSRPFFSRDTK